MNLEYQVTHAPTEAKDQNKVSQWWNMCKTEFPFAAKKAFQKNHWILLWSLTLSASVQLGFLSVIENNYEELPEQEG